MTYKEYNDKLNSEIIAELSFDSSIKYNEEDFKELVDKADKVVVEPGYGLVILDGVKYTIYRVSLAIL